MALTGSAAASILASVGKNRPITVMVEQVLNGSTLRVVLPDMRVTTLTVAGVQCPSLGRRVGEQDPGAVTVSAVDTSIVVRVWQRKVRFGWMSQDNGDALLHIDINKSCMTLPWSFSLVDHELLSRDAQPKFGEPISHVPFQDCI